MNSEEINNVKEKFARWKVPENQIFNEIMRVYQLDYRMFLNPSNSEYGVTVEDLYEYMKETTDTFGPYEGTKEDYAALYTLAMQVNPMDFAPGVVKDGKDVQNFVADLLEVMKAHGKSILLSGADHYLYRLPWILFDLADKDITVAVEDDDWREKLGFLFPRKQVISTRDLEENGKKYDFIFHCAKKEIQSLPCVYGHLKETGSMRALVAYDVLTAGAHEKERRQLAQEGHVATYYDLTMEGEEWGLLDITPKVASHIDFGDAVIEGETVHKYKALSLSMEDFIKSDDWSYDLYRYNASMALQTLLGAHLLSTDHTVGMIYEPVPGEKVENKTIRLIPAGAWEEDLGLRHDLIREEQVRTAATYTPVRQGDLLLFCDGHEVHMAVVDGGEPPLYVDSSVLVLRSKSYYTGDYLKVYLEGPIGGLFMDMFRLGGHMSLPLHRLLRIPVPKAIEDIVDEVTKKGQEGTALLRSAGENWRKVKRDSVQLMMNR